MLKSGTTTFLEAGTIRFLDEVVDGLVEVGIRGRVGRWVWDLPPEPDVYRQTTDEAIGHLERQLTDLRSVADGRIGTWSILVGHTTCSDPLWKAARQLATEHDVGHELPHVARQARPRRLHRRVRAATDDPPRPSSACSRPTWR